MRELKITFKSQLVVWRDLLPITIFSIISIILLIYYDWLSDVENLKLFAIISTFLFIMFFLPTIIIHFNYLKYGEKSVSIGNKQIIIKNKVILETDIYSIDIFAASEHFYSLQLVALYQPISPDYFYLYIRLKDGHVYFLNSLLSVNLDKYIIESFPNIEVKKNKSIPFI